MSNDTSRNPLWKVEQWGICTLLVLTFACWAQPPAHVAMGSTLRSGLAPEFSAGTASMVSMTPSATVARLEASVGTVDGGLGPMFSPNRTVTASTIAIPALVGTAPMVLGVEPSEGSYIGGQTVEIVGIKLVTSGTPTVTIGGAASSVLPGSTSTRIPVVVPPGIRSDGVLKGTVEAVVSTPSNLPSRRSDAYSYTPALEATQMALRGCVAEIRLRARISPGSTGAFALWVGTATSPGTPPAITPSICGGFELTNFALIINGTFTPCPDDCEVLRFPIPDDPAWSGAVFRVQAAFAEILPPLQLFSTCFTNSLDVTIP